MIIPSPHGRRIMEAPFFICLFHVFEGGLFIGSRVYASKNLGK